MGRIGSGPHLVGRIGSVVRVSAIFLKNACLVGCLGSGPHLMADRADAVFSHTQFEQMCVIAAYSAFDDCAVINNQNVQGRLS